MKHFKKFQKLTAALLMVILLISAMPAAIAESFSAYVKSGSMAVYSSASLSKKIGTLGKYSVVKVTSYSGGVAKISYLGKTGYAKISAMQRVDAVADPAVVNTNTKIFTEPKTSSQSAKLAKGTKVNLIAVNGAWALVEKDGVGGYTNLGHLTKTKTETATAAPTATPAPEATAQPTEAPTSKPSPMGVAVINANTKVYKKASTSSAGIKVNKGMKVEVYAVNGDWAYIRSSAGVYAYIPGKYLSASTSATPAPTPDMSKAIPAKVTASSVTVYKSASTSSKAIGSMQKGAQVNVVQIKNDWAYIERNGNFGFCKASGLTPLSELTATSTPSSKGEAVINANTKVYKKASTSSGSANVKKGTKVEVLAVNGDWVYIRSASGVYAYIPGKYLSKPGEENSDEKKLDSPVAAVVTADEAKIYSKPAGGEQIGALPKGTKLNIIATAKSNSWVKIDLDGKQGWCAVSDLGPDKAEEEKDPLDGYVKETFGATIVTTNAKFYDVAGEGDGVSIPFGTNVTVGAYNEKWAFVSVNDRYGFVSVSDLSRTNYTALSKGSTGNAVSTLEKALLAGGYFDGQPDTTYDAATETAVKRFQSACNLSTTGEAGEGLQRMIFSGNAPVNSILSATISKGDKNDNVTRLQTRLFALGYLSKSSSVDGAFGSTTAAAVTMFQTSNDLTASGKADAATLRKMYSTSAVTLPSGKLAADLGGSIVQPSSGDQKTNSTSISSSLASNTSKYSASMSAAEKAEYIIYVAQNQLGKPYVYAANGPSSYDCTGLTCYCFKQVGISLPRTAVSQGYSSKYSRITNISDLKRGDLVFFNTVSDSDLSDHAGIYLGAGWFIHASSGSNMKVVVSTLTSGYYNRVFSWGHRPLQ